MTFTFPKPVDAGEIDLRAVKRDPAARRIVRCWRSEAGGRTLIACSGGADSTALLLALAASEPDLLAVGHVVHDMRFERETLADRDFVGRLSAALGVPFLSDRVSLPASNQEAEARRARYTALADMAREHAIGYIATAHHANDQAETVLMAFLRGAGLSGLRGIAPARSLDGGVTLIRPMLGVAREETERLCRAAGVQWRHDRTNDDDGRLRAATRNEMTHRLTGLRAGSVGRIADAAALLRDAHDVVRDRAEEVFGDGFSWPRAALRRERRIVIGEGLRLAFSRMLGGSGMDRLSRRIVDPVVDAVVDDATERRRFQWPGGLTVNVDAKLVTLRKDTEHA